MKLVQHLARPEWLAVVLGFFFGLTNLILTPPFQVPDEIDHFYRAYQIADGQFIGVKENQRVGGYIPNSLVTTSKRFLYLTGKSHEKVDSDYINESFNIELKPDERSFVDFPNPAIYPPVSYAPQALGIFLLKPFSPSPLSLLYMARLFSLLCWLVALYFAIRLVPFQKVLLVLLGLLPMSTFMHSGCSADVMSNALAFVSIAMILRAIFSTQKATRQELLVLAVLVVLLASAKLVYLPIFLLLAFVPAQRFEVGWKKWATLGVLALVGSSITLAWSGLMSNMYTPYAEYNPAFRDGISLMSCANMAEQKAYILSHGFYFGEVVLHSLNSAFEMYSHGLIGTFGWLDAWLPKWSIGLAWLGLAFIGVFGSDAHTRIAPALRVMLIGVVAVILLLILLSQHLTWDCVGTDVVGTVQGRYLIPILPLVLLALYIPLPRLGKFSRGAALSLAVLLNLVALNTIVNRYYQPSEFVVEHIACGAEEIEPGRLFTTNGSRHLKGAEFRSDAVSRTGNYSLELKPGQAFGFSIKLPDVEPGDSVLVRVWRNAPQGGIVLGSMNGRLFYPQLKHNAVDEQGWQKVEVAYSVNQLLRGSVLNIACWNPDAATTYFDDVEIVHKKLQ